MTEASSEPVAPLLPSPPELAELVADAAGFDALLARLEHEPVVALDTEGNSFHAYTERVCLIQIGLPDRQVVLDPLTVDVKPLAPLLSDKARLWIVHGGDFDVRTLHRDFGFRLGRLFDTMIAAQTMQLPELGLAALLRRHFGVDLRKGEQRSNWGRRPLNASQLVYAASDVRFLLPLHVELDRALQEKGVKAKAEAQFEKLRHVVSRERHFDADAYRRLRGARALDESGQKLLRALWSAREELARELDRPPFKVVSEATMVEMARLRPRDLEALRKLPGVSELLVRRLGTLVMAHREGDVSP